MLSHLGIAIITFVVTNIDDLLILSIYFASPKYATRNIVTGQYLGISTLIIISLAGLIIGKFFSREWVSLLGIIPFFLGIKDLLALRNNGENEEEEKDEQKQKSNLQFLNVAFVTIANGGDNIGVYAPLFANTKSSYVYLYIITWLLLTGALCFLGYQAVSHHRVKTWFTKYGKLILPIFLIILGLFIMKDFIQWVTSSPDKNTFYSHL